MFICLRANPSLTAAKMVLLSILGSVYRIITQASLRTRPSTGPGESLPTSHSRIVRKLRHLSDISNRGPATPSRENACGNRNACCSCIRAQKLRENRLSARRGGVSFASDGSPPRQSLERILFLTPTCSMISRHDLRSLTFLPHSK
jgi:hypothetical protein